MRKLSHVRAITLDLDDTLWPIAPTIARAEVELHTWLGRQAPGSLALLADRTALTRLRALAMESLASSTHDPGAVRREVIRLMLIESDEDPALSEPAYAVFFQARQRVEPFDGVVEALDRLSQRYPIVSISNGNADLRVIGLDRFFMSAVSAGVLGVAKPHPRIFLEAAQRLGVEPHQALHVGDDPHLDVVGARNAGMGSAWINTSGAVWPIVGHAPDLTFSRFVDLVDHVLACG